MATSPCDVPFSVTSLPPSYHIQASLSRSLASPVRVSSLSCARMRLVQPIVFTRTHVRTQAHTQHTQMHTHAHAHDLGRTRSALPNMCAPVYAARMRPPAQAQRPPVGRAHTHVHPNLHAHARARSLTRTRQA
eukprot:6203781-Pleurochrysis_carterae.AAC.1